MCEYCHAMGSGPGDFEDYFQVFQQYDGACGGFVCGSGVIMPFTWARPLKEEKIRVRRRPHGVPADGNFAWGGRAYPDRTPHTGLREFKNVHRPARVVSFDQEKKEAVLHNYMDYVNLKDYLYITYTVNCDGSMIGEGCIHPDDMHSISAHEEGVIALDYEVRKQVNVT